MEKLLRRSQKEIWLDAVKGLGILLMVIGHANAPETVKLWIYGFHMPLFFFLAGYMFDENKWKQRGFASMVLSRGKAYLIPYFILFVINLIWKTTLDIVKNRIVDGHTFNSVLIYIGAGIYSHDTLMPNCAPLWFLTCLFVSYILFWNLIMKPNSTKKVLWIVAYLTVLWIICIIERKLTITQLPWHIDVALIASVSMLFGNVCHMIQPRVEQFSGGVKFLLQLMAFLIATVIIIKNGRIIMVINQYQNIPMFVFSATMMSALIIFIVRELYVIKNGLIEKLFSILAFWGHDTLIFIGFNYLINTVVWQILKAINLDYNIFYCILDTVAVMFGCSIIIILWNKSKNKFAQRQHRLEINS